MRPVDAAQGALIANPPVGLLVADLFTLRLQDGSTTYRWTSFDSDITVTGIIRWKYKIEAAGSSSNYSSPTYDDSAWAVGLPPFGTADFSFPGSFGYDTVPLTVFDQQVTLFLRGTLPLLAVPASYAFDAIIDNGATVWFNGVQVFTDFNANAHHVSTSLSSANLVVGDNLMAVKVVDDGLGVRPGNWQWFDTHVPNPVIFSSRKPWLSRSLWNLTNTMEIPTMDVVLEALNDSFAGGADIKAQIHDGLFDGATFTLNRVFLEPGQTSVTSPTPGLLLFGGAIANIDLIGNKATLHVKGKSNLLAQNAPRNLYQPGCIHAFCDAGCTLSRATFTTSYTVGSSPAPSGTFIPWSSAPSNPGRYKFGTIRFTSGPASGQSRTVRAADASGLTLTYPLTAIPAAGDGFTAFEGCDKALNSGSGQDCTARTNTQNWRGFDLVPQAETAF